MNKKIQSLLRFISPNYQTVHLEYKVNPQPRFNPHPMLYDIINSNREDYSALLRQFLTFSDQIHQIRDSKVETDENLPAWNNGFLPGLDIVALYGMIAINNPAHYIEIGSGNSTKVARKAVNEQHLTTQIISIDPHPRANIDHLADKVIRKPLENLEDLQFIIDTLEENDILFIDNSHRVFPNSDATICFLELLPRLKKGVIVHFHDIYLPYDYPQFMCDRFYSEQYMLAAWLLSGGAQGRVSTLMPNFFVSEDKELSAIIAPIWNHANLEGVERHGGSFWLKII